MQKMQMTADTDAKFMDRRRAILLVDHGSKRQAANNMLISMRDTVAARLGEDAIVHIAHMELAKPSIEDGFKKCIADGVNHVVVVPFFLAPGRHSTTDIPAMTAEAAAAYPDCTFEIREHLGSHPSVADAVIDRAVNDGPSPTRTASPASASESGR